MLNTLLANVGVALKGLLSIHPSQLFQLILTAVWTLPVLPETQNKAMPMRNVLLVGPAVNLHSHCQIIRVNSAIPDEFLIQYHSLISHML